MVLVAAGVGVLHLQGVVGFLHKKEEVVALQKAVLEQQEQVEQPAQAVVLGLGVLMVQEGASLKQSEALDLDSIAISVFVFVLIEFDKY